MRVISGIRRGAALYCPETEGLRPTTDRVKENIFNLIQSGVAGKNVLDLFAGSGAMGIEAISRGALGCVFVDSGAESLSAVRKNIKKLRFEEKARITASDAQVFLSSCREKFQLVFLDPPYHSGLVEKSLRMLIDKKALSQGALIVTETDSDELSPDFPELSEITKRIYGRVKVTVYTVR